MNFLRLLSQEGHQNFTYTCINSAAWFNTKSNSYEMAMKFMGENSVEFSSEPGSPKVDVLVDGCKVKLNSYSFFLWFPPSIVQYRQFSLNWHFVSSNRSFNSFSNEHLHIIIESKSYSCIINFPSIFDDIRLEPLKYFQRNYNISKWYECIIIMKLR